MKTKRTKTKPMKIHLTAPAKALYDNDRARCGQAHKKRLLLTNISKMESCRKCRKQREKSQ